MVARLRVIMPIVALVSMYLFVPWTLFFAWVKPLPDSVKAQMQEALGTGLDGMIVYIDQGGSEPTVLAAGWKDRAERIPADPQSLFKIASIGKLYIAAAVTKLVAAGQLALDDTLADYLPALAGRIENADKITLKHLLQHRSGIPNFTDQPDYPWANPPKNNQESLALVLDKPAEFEPGSDYQYSNTNYLLLAEIIDLRLGYSHQQYILKEILQPLDLKHTYASMREVDPVLLMSGYHVGYDLDIKSNFFGSMLATAEDVGIFLRALNDKSLFSESEQKIYTSVYEYGHTGLLPGYSSIARYHEDIDAVVVQFVNTTGADTWTLTEISYNRIVNILRTK